MGNWIVLLISEDGRRPVPFGTWHDPLEAAEWAETGLQRRDGETFIVTQIRMVSEGE